jgi:RHS repeat-associated protein
LGTYILNSAKTDTIFYYDHSDWLGTERARINLSGTACEKIASLAFGDGQTIASTCGEISPMHFTGKERDTESGLDYFGARHNGSSIGRFMTVDPSRMSAFIEDPQSWNRYSYVHNNPLRLVDKNGKWPTDIHKQIIELAFTNLTPEQRQILKDVSAQQDNALTSGQANSGAYQHAMTWSNRRRCRTAVQRFCERQRS